MGDTEDMAPRWARPLMRTGYIGRGVVYVTIGWLTLQSSLGAPTDSATTSALVSLRDMPFGTVVLFGIAVAFFAYAAWEVMDAVFDLDRYGTDAKGIASRAVIAAMGFLYVALGVLTFFVATRRAGGDGESGVDVATAHALGLPFGRTLVIAGGAIVIAAGLYFLKHAWTEDYKDKVVRNTVTDMANPLMKFGVAAHGLIVLLIGAFFVGAAWTYDSSKAGGMQQAFDTIRSFTAGQALLMAVAVGFFGFALVCFVNAAYRLVPARVGPRDDRTVMTGETAAEAARG